MERAMDDGSERLDLKSSIPDEFCDLQDSSNYFISCHEGKECESTQKRACSAIVLVL